MIAALLALFALSGAAGLIYESIWTRYLGLFVGHSAYAQIIVLVIFLGGMSLGAQVVARWSRRLGEPLAWYAFVELLAGVAGYAFHSVYVAATGFAYDSAFASLGGTPLLVAKWAIAALLILPQSILLGATFPLMSAGLIRLAGAASHPGRLLALLYFSNSLGAAVGALVAGLWLVAAFGLPGTVRAAAHLNVIVALVVVALLASRAGAGGWRQWMRRRLPDAAPATPTPGVAYAVAPGILIVVAFLTAVSSFVYEIAWIRMLSLVFGSSTHSFEIMLSAFILGLALGALWIHRRADALADPVRSLGVIHWAMGVLAVATLPLYVQAFDWFEALLPWISRDTDGYRQFFGIRYVVAMAIMLPATFCAGMTLPLITRMLWRWRGEGAVGAVYAVNTLGSIVGVVLAGLVLMPLLGTKRLLLAGAAIDVALGIWLVARAAPERRFARIGGFALATVIGIAAITFLSRFDPSRLSSGVYRSVRATGEPDATFPFHRDGRTATVTVKRQSNGSLALLTNGKPDASLDAARLSSVAPARRDVPLPSDAATQFLLPLVTLAHQPHARSIAVIGQGSGISTHLLLGSPEAREVVTIEIEPLMIEGSRYFRPANDRAFVDSRSRVVIDDARSYFASAPREWDLILSEPSNPWVSGVSGLFTTEFYRHVAGRLAPGGVFGQWLHLYESNDELVTSVLAAIASVFPSYEIFFTSWLDVLIVASAAELPDPDWSVANYPGIQKDLRHGIEFGPEWFETLRIAGRTVLSPLLAEATLVNSDFRPVLDLGAERARFAGEGASGYASLPQARFDVVAALTGRRLGFGFAPQSPMPVIPRSAGLAFSTRLRAQRLPASRNWRALAREPRMLEALLRYDRIAHSMVGSAPPQGWRLWMDDVIAVDTALHSGTAGVADTVFFRSVSSYVARARAPEGVRDAIHFLHGIAAWDWPEAAAAARRMMASSDTLWLPKSLVRDGAATAFIMTRDPASAGAALQRFNDPDGQFRAKLLAAILRSIEAKRSARGGGP